MSIKKSFAVNYLKIYFWQGLSILLGFLSMFIVTPFLSGDRSVFGIYSVCISVSIFLAYADLGFLGSGQKYAAEEYARGNLEEERRIVGFSGFILLVFVLVCSAVFFYLSYFPSILITNLSSDEKKIASSLLFVLAFFAPVTVLQRITQMIYSIRIEDFIYQRISICGNIVRIISTFYFFRQGHYDIVAYFTFIQITNIIVVVIMLILANRRYAYSILNLFKSIRFDVKIFTKTKSLAFSSLFLTFSWILYYECDNFVIGKLLGPEKIAIYAMGFTLMSFLRSILGTLFMPFSSRFNQYCGVNDIDGLKKSFSQVISFTLPLVVLFISTILILLKPLIFTWVGAQYASSVSVAWFLVACNLFAFISYPCGLLLSAQLRIKTLYVMGAILPFVYWMGVIFTYSWLGLESFAIFKFIAFSLSALLYLIITLKYLGFSIWKFLEYFIFRNIPSFVILCSVLFYVRDFLPLYKTKIGLLQVVSLGGVTCISCMVLSFFMNSDARNVFASLKLKKKSKDELEKN